MKPKKQIKTLMGGEIEEKLWDYIASKPPTKLTAHIYSKIWRCASFILDDGLRSLVHKELEKGDYNET